MDKLKEFYKKLPEKTKKYIESGKMQKSFIKIEDTYKLNEQESLVIQEELLAFMLNIVTLENFKDDVILILRDRSKKEIGLIISKIEKTIFNNK